MLQELCLLLHPGLGCMKLCADMQLGHRAFAVHHLLLTAAPLQVVCPQCKYVSRTSHPFLALELEITRANTVKQALRQHTAEERLDASNKWRCEQHRGLVQASKRLSLGRLPPVLILSLKRFSQQARGRKLSKQARFRA